MNIINIIDNLIQTLKDLKQKIMNCVSKKKSD